MMLRIALSVFFGVAILIGGFAFFIPHANRGGEEAPASPVSTSVTPAVTISDSYRKGTHALTGSILAPTPCTSVSAIASVASSTPESILVAISMPPDTGICLQQATAISFTVSALAGADATIQTLVNGVLASTTLR
ncbi:MAG: hypothetical protein Q7R54_00275 [bacterium]|nr:hypothetical protein [bacterium]